MQELIQKLEVAVLRRNPALAGNLQTGLSAEKIKKDLKRAGVEGAIGPIIELYSWKNGSVLRGNSAEFRAGLEAGFTPPTVVQLSEDVKQAMLLIHGVKRETDMETFHFMELGSAIVDMKSFKEYAAHQPRFAVLVGRYFPFLWNGSTAWIAIDTEPSDGNRIFAIEIDQTKNGQPLREVYDSFEAFLKDAIRANENNEPLSCFKTRW